MPKTSLPKRLADLLGEVRDEQAERKRFVRVDRDSGGDIFEVHSEYTGLDGTPPKRHSDRPTSAGADDPDPTQHQDGPLFPENSPRYQGTVIVAPGEPIGRIRERTRKKYIALDATLTTERGATLRFRTRKISMRGLFLITPTRHVALQRGMVVRVELAGEEGPVEFDAEVVQKTTVAVERDVGSGVGLRILLISRGSREALARLIAESEEFVPAAPMKLPFLQRILERRAKQSDDEALASLGDEEADAMFATASGIGSRPRSTRAHWTPLVIGAAAVFVVLGLATYPFRTAPPAPKHSSTIAPTYVDPHPIRITLRASPSDATFQIDDEAPLPNLYDGTRAHSGRHIVRVTAPGYEDVAREVDFDEDVTLDVALQRRARPGGP